MHAVEVNLLARDDPPQAACADAFVGTSAWMSHWVLAEALWVPESVCGRTPAQLAAALLLPLAHKRLSLLDADAVAAALLHFKRKPSLGFFNCLMFEIARKARHLPVGTFDKGLSKPTAAKRL